VYEVGSFKRNVFRVNATRTQNWQKFCCRDPSLLAFLLRISVNLDDGVSPIILQLIQSALCPQPVNPAKRSGKSSSPIKSIRKEKSKSQEPDLSEQEDLSFVLVNQVL
jgi:E3 ubiquitin-protein ligase UBR4